MRGEAGCLGTWSFGVAGRVPYKPGVVKPVIELFVSYQRLLSCIAKGNPGVSRFCLNLNLPLIFCR